MTGLPCLKTHPYHPATLYLMSAPTPKLNYTDLQTPTLSLIQTSLIVFPYLPPPYHSIPLLSPAALPSRFLPLNPQTGFYDVSWSAIANEASWYGLYTGFFTHYFPVGQQTPVCNEGSKPPKDNPDLSLLSVMVQHPGDGDRGSSGRSDNDSTDRCASDFDDNETANNSEVNISFTSDGVPVKNRIEGGREAVLIPDFIIAKATQFKTMDTTLIVVEVKGPGSPGRIFQLRSVSARTQNHGPVLSRRPDEAVNCGRPRRPSCRQSGDLAVFS
ncbi:hypothetical protein J3A83DRAFT_4224678 [Scleroderma citrinum]